MTSGHYRKPVMSTRMSAFMRRKVFLTVKIARVQQTVPTMRSFMPCGLFLHNKTEKETEGGGRVEHTAYLSSAGKYTSFMFRPTRIRFRTSDKLIRYERVKEWNKGYIVVDALYSTLGTVEEYIDLVPILEKLLLDPQSFLKPIREVAIWYA